MMPLSIAHIRLLYTAARQNEEDGNAHEYPGTPSALTSSLRLHTQTVELGPDTSLHARSEVLCPRERVIVVSSRLLSSKHVGTIDNILPEI